MRKLLILTFLLFSFVTAQKIEAKGVIVYHNGSTISKVVDLPADAKIEGSHVNLGVMYEQFGLFWLPVWNYGETQYVMIDDAEETYWEVDDEFLQSVKEEFNLDLPVKAQIPFWSKVGLKPVILILIALIIWGQIGGKKKEEEVQETDPNTQA